MLRIAIALIVLAMAAPADAASIAVAGGGVAAAGPSCTSGNVLHETFDTNPGYDNAGWTEHADRVIDEDFTAPSANGFSGQCLRSYNYTQDWWAYADYGFTAADEIYSRFYIYINSTTLSGQSQKIAAITGVPITLWFKELSGHYYIYSLNDGHGTESTAVEVSLQTSYRVEIHIKHSTNVIEWKVDGSAIGGPSSQICDGDPSGIQLGTEWKNGNSNLDIYFDKVDVSTTGWLGACD